MSIRELVISELEVRIQKSDFIFCFLRQSVSVRVCVRARRV